MPASARMAASGANVKRTDSVTAKLRGSLSEWLPERKREGGRKEEQREKERERERERESVCVCV
jgi:hypothetical protein